MFKEITVKKMLEKDLKGEVITGVFYMILLLVIIKYYEFFKYMQ
jgi:hypothetical protein